MPATYEPIATVTLSAAGDLSIFNIPQTYTDLVLSGAARGSNAGAESAIYFGFSGTYGTANSYSVTRFWGNGSAVTSDRLNNQPFFTAAGGIPGNNAPANSFGGVTIHIMDYANTNLQKSVLVRTGGTTSGGAGTYAVVGSWMSTAAVTSIFLTAVPALAAGSTFTLFGIKAA